ncbi:MAG TPA: hypothetical protein VE981_06505 [Planctomycetota bacterium]|nr:hypothetical protein [Planctomycetota bacterium]
MRLALAAALVMAGCTTPASPQARQQPPLRLAWEKNMLAVTGDFPGGRIDILYLEAYCRSGARDVEWKKTVIPHKAEKLSDDGRTITLRDTVEGGVVVNHRIAAGDGRVDFEVEATNQGSEFVDAQWVQPCVRVGAFTGGTQRTYVDKSFVFIDGRRTFLPQARRTEEAIYKGGQLYIPAGIDRKDCNPRPHSPDVPSNDLIGCVSADGLWLFATAWTPTQELFQGVIVCLHNDFRLGGLKPGETKRARGKIYIMENDVDLLLARYRRDFP